MRAVFFTVVALAASTPAFSQEKLVCVQQSRQMCEQGKGCKRLVDEAPNQWFFEINTADNSGKAKRCSGSDCARPFHLIVMGKSTEEITAWEPVANEAFAFSPDRKQFTHSLTGARGNGGHVVSEFGHCTRG